MNQEWYKNGLSGLRFAPPLIPSVSLGGVNHGSTHANSTKRCRARSLYQNMIVVSGGECRNQHTYSENEAYDLNAGRWSTLAPLPAGRHGFGAVVIGRSLYFVAGALDCGGGGRLSDELLVFTLPINSLAQ